MATPTALVASLPAHTMTSVSGLSPSFSVSLGLDGGDGTCRVPPASLAVLIDLEPIALRAALHLAVAEQLVDLLARQLAVRDGHGLDRLTAQRLNSFSANSSVTSVAVRSMRRSGLSLP